MECGKLLPRKATSSICAKCLKRMERRIMNHEDDHDFSMNY